MLQSLQSLQVLQATIEFSLQGCWGWSESPRGTLVPHTSRAFYMALVWKSSKTPSSEIPPLSDYCWEAVKGHLKPIFCLSAPAPDALLELRKCNCRTGCKRQSRGCKKNNLVCTDLCGCWEKCESMILDKPVDTDETDWYCCVLSHDTAYL